MKKIIYFSGTGNTKILAEKLSSLINVDVHSIEDDINWEAYLDEANKIIFMYPIYYSMPPMIVRDFISKYYNCFENKKVISLITQMCFSGDGARIIEDFLPESCEVVYTRHFNMPNNIPNIPFVPIASEKGKERKIKRAVKKLEKSSKEIYKEEWKRRATSNFSKKLGDLQRKEVFEREKEHVKKVWVNDDCIACGLCEKICPKNNFIIKDNTAVPQDKCTLCLRCENKCPKKAIRVLIKKPIKKQYSFKLK